MSYGDFRMTFSRKLIFGVILFLLPLILASCGSIKSYDTIRVITDNSFIDSLKNKSDSVKSINAELDIIPSTLKAPSIGAYMSYNKEGFFRLAGLSPNGFSLFDFQSQDDKFTLSLSNRLEISGDLNEFRNGFKTLAGRELPVEPDMIKETIDFYGINQDDDTTFLIEELRDSYILTQLKHDDKISYPLRRWWLDKDDKTILRKEVFSRNPDKKGEILLEAVYGDFRIIDNVQTPFDISIREKKGKKLLNMKFTKVEYNK
ncbi:MAG: hypothetical protein HZA08_09920 [Nitrospirae bacterium]|nr:hypothetical protein [Nitrospirota bacterium]